MNVISSCCHISNNQVLVDGALLFACEQAMPYGEFFIAAYRNLGITYPKFFKMDELCKLAFLTSEYLLRADIAFAATGGADTGIVISNKASSLHSDRIHAASIRNKESYFPSPAVFVYTLPNILIGEISIRHKITGENACFITNGFDAGLVVPYVNQLLNELLVKACLTGWVELDGCTYEAFLYLAVPSAGTHKNSNFNEHSAEQLKDLGLTS